jgi:hypothetical protein
MADANLVPFDQLAGVILKLYIHTTEGTAEPAVTADPTASGFVLVGPTDGGQTLNFGGAKTKFYDDDHQGPVKAVRPQEDVTIDTMIVGLTLEDWARVIHAASLVTSAAGPPAVKRMPLKRGRTSERYTVVFRAPFGSPYGNFPMQVYIPIAEFDGEPAPAFAKDGRAGLDISIFPIEDDTQSAGNEMGWLTAQTS